MNSTSNTDPRGSQSRLFAGVRTSDWVLASLLTFAGVGLMAINLAATPQDVERELAAGTLVHAITPNSWLIIPVFALTTVPLLWWRRGVFPVACVILAATLLHVVWFGWLTRCGVALPIAFTLAFLGTLEGRRWQAPASVAASLLLIGAVLSRDATTGWAPWPACLALVVLAAALGALARRRNEAIAKLASRTAELAQLREERAALEVAAERSGIAHRVDDLLTVQLAELAALAERGRGLAEAEILAAFEAIETRSRKALEDTRDVVGVLRGDAVHLAPPSDLDRLESRLRRVGGRGCRG